MASPAELGSPALPAVSGEARALLARWLRMWNGELEIAEAIIADKLTVHIPRFGMPDPSMVHDPGSMAAWIGAFRGSFSEARFTCDLGPFPAGGFLISRFSFTGTWRGGRPPTATAASGTAVQFYGVDILRIDGGRIAEYWLSDDQLDLYAQLGAVR